MKTMEREIRSEVLRRLESDYGLQHAKGTPWMRKGTCPSCGKRELYSRQDEPWFIRCGRESKCGEQWHVKELFEDLFDDWSKRAPASEATPNASVDSYLQFARGFDLNLIKGWYSQDNYWDRTLGFGSATVRFDMPDSGYWERLIDRPHRFGGKKARFKPGYSYKGHWWCPPCIDLLEAKELWIVEGIFDAIALLHHGIAAVSAMSSNAFPEDSLKELARRRGGKLPKLVWALDNEPSGHSYTRKHVKLARDLGYSCTAAQIPQRDRKVDWNDLHQRWAFIDDAAKRADKIERDLAQARHHGALLLAESAEEKGVLMYTWEESAQFYFEFGNRTYWFKYDDTRYQKEMERLRNSESASDKLLNDRQMREKALRASGSVIRIANCAFKGLYFQRNEITDESWYYFRIDFPWDASSALGTFTANQVASAP